MKINIGLRSAADFFYKKLLPKAGKNSIMSVLNYTEWFYLDIKAIIFDKDGTLLDFDSFWIEVSVCALKDILKKLGKENIPAEEILGALGVSEGTVDIDGLLCKGTYEQIGIAIYDVLKKYEVDVSSDETVKMTLEAYNKNADFGIIKPACENLRETLERLKNSGIRLAVVTTDNGEITHKCLEGLGIENLFDMVYTDDGKTPVKPDPWCAKDFCGKFGISAENAVMVGDTATDVRFAKNAGIFVIGVGRERERLASSADAVIPNVSHIFEVIKGA